MRQEATAARLPGGAATINIATWKGRALICTDHFLPGKKEKYVSTLLLRANVLTIQETHGDGLPLALTANRFATTHLAQFSPATTPTSGGLLTLLSHRFLHNIGAEVDNISSTIVAPGRIMVTDINTKDATRLTVANVHNYDLSPTQRHMLRSITVDRTHDSLAHTGGVSLLLVAGDHHNVPSANTLTSRSGSDGSVRTHPRATDTRRWTMGPDFFDPHRGGHQCHLEVRDSNPRRRLKQRNRLNHRLLLHKHSTNHDPSVQHHHEEHQTFSSVGQTQ